MTSDSRLRRSAADLLRAEHELARLKNRFRQERHQVAQVLAAVSRLPGLDEARLYERILALLAQELDYDRVAVFSPTGRELTSHFRISAAIGVTADRAFTRGELAPGVEHGAGAELLDAVGAATGLVGTVALRTRPERVLFVGRSPALADALEPPGESERRVFELVLAQIAAQLDNQVLIAELRDEHQRLLDANRLLAARMDELEQTRRQLEGSSRLELIGQVATDVAQEITTPLAFVSANARAARRCVGALVEGWRAAAARLEELGDGETADEIAHRLRLATWLEEGEETIGDLASGIERIRFATEDLRTFARPPQHGQRAEIGRVVETAVRLARPTLTQTARLTVEGDTSSIVPGSPVRLAQALVNLLLHAADGLPVRLAEHNPIVLAVAGGDEVRIAVRAEGIARTSPRRAVAERILADHLGRLEAAPGELVARLPTRPTARWSSEPLPHDERVLFVDPDVLTLRSYRRAFDDGPIRAVCAAGVGAALEALEADRAIDLVVCDVSCPDLMRLLEVVRDRWPMLAGRCAFLAAAPPPALAALGVPFLDKPLDPEALADLLRRLSTVTPMGAP